ncbi:heat shock protein 30 [Xylariales sp. AK1849]|nr:heat shock protein 30 [Xylariales sp. AK1849]
MGLIIRANDALGVNPPTGNDNISLHGSDWLWAVTAIFALSFLIFFATSFKARFGEKIFHYIFTITLLVGTLTYFAWASDLGYQVVTGRQIFYTKYIFWLIEFPAIIIALGLLSGVSWATIIYNVFLSWIWVIAYLVAALTSSSYKWGFFTLGTIAWAILAYNTVVHGSSTSKRLGVSSHYSLLAGWTNFLWLLWPIAFGVTDGGRTIGVTPTAIFFGILDLLLLPVLAFAFLGLSRKWDYNNLNLAFTRYGRIPNTGHFPGKSTAAPTHGGVTTGTAAP